MKVRKRLYVISLRAASTNGAGIGGANGQSGGNIYISENAVVKSMSHNGAGIGGGSGGCSGDILVNGGTVTAMSREAAGIGGGKGAPDPSPYSEIAIGEGTVNVSITSLIFLLYVFLNKYLFYLFL